MPYFILYPSSFILHPSAFKSGHSEDDVFQWTFMARDLAERTKSFALRIINLYSALPTTSVAQVLGKQILRSGTSVGAHYREAHRARSTAEFVSKINGGLQELEETAYWLEPA